MPLPWDLLAENLVSAVVIVGYLAYEIRIGKGKAWGDKLSGLVSVVIALAEENPQIDEEAVVDRFNGDRPKEYKDPESSKDPVMARQQD